MEKKQEQQSGNKSQRNERKGGSLKISGSSSINGDDASSLVGSIIEKGIISSDNNSRKPIKPPTPSVLPFPVARHRSHGPHWTLRSNRNIDEEDEEDDEDESGLAKLDPISIFAKPVQRKEKKGLDLSLSKELMQSDDSSKSMGRETSKSHLRKTERRRVDGEAMENVGKKSTLSDSLGAHGVVVASMEVDVNSHLNANGCATKIEEAVSSELIVSTVTNMDLDDSHQLHQQENVKDADSDNLTIESGLMAMDGQVSVERMFHNYSDKAHFGRMEKMDPTQTTVPNQFHNFGNEQESMSLESEINAENCARLDNMSPGEIAQARAEIMEKMDPALLNLLKKRGREKLKRQKHSSSNLAANSELDITHDNQSNNAVNSRNIESNNSQMVTTFSNNTKSGVDNGMEQNVGPVNGSLWNAWSRRVEAVGELRFSLDGTVVKNDFFRITKTSKAKS